MSSGHMNLILLGGNNVGNKKWIRAVEKQFKPHFKTHVLPYKHWDTGNEWINPDEELKRLARLGNRLGDYMIFSRSAGTLITLMGDSRSMIKPARCIFVGIAIKWSEYFDPDYDNWLKNFKTPSLLIQKTHDPAISCRKLKKFLDKRNLTDYKLKEIPGEDHYYGDIEELRDLTVDFYKKKSHVSPTPIQSREKSPEHPQIHSLIHSA